MCPTHTHTHTTAHTIREKYRSQEDNFVYEGKVAKSVLAKQRDWLTGTYIQVGEHQESSDREDPSMGSCLLNGRSSTDTSVKSAQVSTADKRGGACEVIGTVGVKEGKEEYANNRVYGKDGCSPTILARDWKDPVRIGWND